MTGRKPLHERIDEAGDRLEPKAERAGAVAGTFLLWAVPLAVVALLVYWLAF